MKRRTSIATSFGLAAALAFTVLFSGAVAFAKDEKDIEQVQIRADAEDVVQPFNRSLFSVTGYAQMQASGSALAKETTDRIVWSGTQARIETIMAQAFPKPDQFLPEKMFRFVDNSNDSYFNLIKDKGMEPVLLLAGNVPWLTRTGNTADAPTDPKAWAELAAKIVEHYNGSGDNYRLNVKYLEIWNEPNLSMFWKGTWDQYFELFNTVADVIHERYPGVMVGGPALSPATKPTEFGKAFIDHCGNKMDYFIYHAYGDPVSKVSSDMTMWEDYIRQQTSREPKVMVTESDNWFDGFGKIQYMLQRQFALLPHSGSMLGYHQFSLLAYKEGNYTFGLINQNGTVIEGTFWPYWIFRDAKGSMIRSNVEIMPASADDPFSPSLVATKSDDGKEVNVVYYAGTEGKLQSYNTKFSIKLSPFGCTKNLYGFQGGGDDKGYY